MARVIDARNAGPMLRSGFELQRDELPLDVPKKISYGTQCLGPLFSFSGVDEPAAVRNALVAMHCDASGGLDLCFCTPDAENIPRPRLSLRLGAVSTRVLAATSSVLVADGLTCQGNTAVAAGGSHTCALLADGRLVCFGDGDETADGSALSAGTELNRGHALFSRVTISRIFRFTGLLVGLCLEVLSLKFGCA